MVCASIAQSSIDMIEIDVRVPGTDDNLMRLQSSHVTHHEAQERVACNVERDTEADIRTSLIDQDGQLVARRDELECEMIGR